MKKILFLSLFLSTVLSGLAQNYPSPIITNPNNSYGTRNNRGEFDSTIYIPTGCGVPTDTTWLFSQGTSTAYPGYGQKMRMAAKYYDSCAHHEYTWDPSLQLWKRIDSSGGGGGTGDSGIAVIYAPLSGIPMAIIPGIPRFLQYDTSAGNAGAITTRGRSQWLADSLGALIAGKLSAISTTNSVAGNGTAGSPVQLVGDAPSPGNSYYYGTNSSGAKGYNVLPSGITLANPSATISGTPVNGSAVTAMRSDAAPAIATNAVTNSLLAQAPAATIKGNNTGGTANDADLTVSQVNNMLGTVTQLYGKLPITISGTDTVLADTTIGTANALATIYRLYFVMDSLASVSGIVNAHPDGASDTLTYGVGPVIFVRSIQDTSTTGRITISKSLSTTNTVIYNLDVPALPSGLFRFSDSICNTINGVRVCVLDSAGGGGGSSQPFPDNAALIENNSDHTKTIAIYAGNQATATNIVDTLPTTNTMLAGTDVTDTFNVDQYYRGNILFNSSSSTIGNGTHAVQKVYAQNYQSPGGMIYSIGTGSTYNYNWEFGGVNDMIGFGTTKDWSISRTTALDDTKSLLQINGLLTADSGVNFNYIPTGYTTSDTGTHKPVSMDASGNLYRETYWPGSGGSGTGLPLFSQTANGTAIVNTTTATALMGTGTGSLTVAANTMAVGQVYILHGTFNYQETGTPTVTFNPLIASTGFSPGVQLSTTGTSGEITITYTVLSIGSSGSIGTNFVVSTGGGSPSYYSSGTGLALTVNTTSSVTFGLTAAWSAASSSNSIQSTPNFTLSLLGSGGSGGGGGSGITLTTNATPYTASPSGALNIDTLRQVRVFNARDFGAVGDGVTDATAAIQATFKAADASILAGQGAKAVIDGGVFKVTAPILDSVSHFYFETQGVNTQILATGDYGDVFVFGPTVTPTTAGAYTDLHIKDVYINSSVRRTSGWAIHTRWTHQATIENVRIGTMNFTDAANGVLFYKGIDFDTSSNWVLSNCQVNAWWIGVRATGDYIFAPGGGIGSNYYDGLITHNCNIWGDKNNSNYVSGSTGVDIGGGTGGVQISQSAISQFQNGVHAYHFNRELFFDHAFIGDDMGGSGAWIEDTLNILNIAGAWFSGDGRAGFEHSYGLYVDSTATGLNPIYGGLAPTSIDIEGGTSYANDSGGMYLGEGDITINGVNIYDNGTSTYTAPDIVLGGNINSAIINTRYQHLINNSTVLPLVTMPGSLLLTNPVSASWDDLKLKTGSSDSTDLIEYGNAASGTTLGITNANATMLLNSGGPMVLGTHSSYPVYFGTNNAIHGILDQSGNLQLGSNAAPMNGAVDVEQNVNGIVALNIHNSNTGTGADAQIKLNTNGDSSYITQYANSFSYAPFDSSLVIQKATPGKTILYNTSASAPWLINFLDNNVQVGNSFTESPSSAFTVASTSKGALLPILTNTQISAISSPATGLIVYASAANTFEFNSGTPSSPVWTSLLYGSSASYTSTLINLVNITSSTLQNATYSVNGNVVHIMIAGTVTPTSSSTSTTLELSLPSGLASSYSTSANLGSGFAGPTTASAANAIGLVQQYTSSTSVTFTWYCPAGAGGTAVNFAINFDYYL